MTALWASCLLLGLWLMTTGGHSQALAELNHGALECYAGAVRCDDGYLYSQDDISFHRGQQEWGECRRHLWTGEEANRRIGIYVGFPLARPRDANLAVCVSIKPLHFTRATIDLYNEDGQIVVSHFDIRMKLKNAPQYDNSIVINEARYNNRWNWGKEDVYYYSIHYPFFLGRESTVKFVAANDNTLVYLVNGKVVATRHLRMPLTEVAKVVVWRDAIITRVNVWCK